MILATETNRMMPVSVPPVMIQALVFIVARISPSLTNANELLMKQPRFSTGLAIYALTNTHAKVWKYFGRSLMLPSALPVTDTSSDG